MRLVLSCCFLVSLLFLPISQSLAATQYVSDEITILLRRGPGTEYKILKTLQTGASVEVLEEGSQYFLVRSQDGTEGYVLRQYLTTELPKSMVIARLNEEKERLQSTIDDIKRGAGTWVDEKQELQRQLVELQQSFESEKNKRLEVTRSYESLQAGARNVTELVSERDRLQAETERQAEELKKLRQENESMLRRAMVNWFLAGAGVLFVGWFMGKRSRPKKRGF
ncbi:MAG: TIGR04211 family SH3 domain-containing protein [Syntrophotaleaceae bacterium]